MTPLMLTIIGVALVALASLVSALRAEGRQSAQAKLILSLPLAATAVVLYFSPDLLSLHPFGSESGELISLTVQYDLPARGLAVIESPNSIAHPFSGGLVSAFALIASLSLLSALSFQSARRRESSRRADSVSVLAAAAWLILGLIWAFTHSSIPLSGGEGESGVRELLRLISLDPLRVKNFSIPGESWYFSTTSLLPLILSMGASLLLLLSKLFIHAGVIENKPESDITKNELGSTASSLKFLAQLGALVAVISSLWSASSYGFSGTASDLAIWGSAAIIASATSAQLPHVARGAVATLCLITLCLTTFP